MTLRLSPKDQAEYLRRSAEHQDAKAAAQAIGDDLAARRARQAQSALYKEFENLQLPPPPMTKWEAEEAMTLEARVARLEEHLKLGRFSV